MSDIEETEGTYEDFYFNYGLNYDLKIRFRPTSETKPHSINSPIVSGNNEISNTFVFTQYKTLSTQKQLEKQVYF